MDLNSEIDDEFTGPFLEDGAPYSGMAIGEFHVLQPLLVLVA